MFTLGAKLCRGHAATAHGTETLEENVLLGPVSPVPGTGLTLGQGSRPALPELGYRGPISKQGVLQVKGKRYSSPLDSVTGKSAFSTNSLQEVVSEELAAVLESGGREDPREQQGQSPSAQTGKLKR